MGHVRFPFLRLSQYVFILHMYVGASMISRVTPGPELLVDILLYCLSGGVPIGVRIHGFIYSGNIATWACAIGTSMVEPVCEGKE